MKRRARRHVAFLLALAISTAGTLLQGAPALAAGTAGHGDTCYIGGSGAPCTVGADTTPVVLGTVGSTWTDGSVTLTVDGANPAATITFHPSVGGHSYGLYWACSNPSAHTNLYPHADGGSDGNGRTSGAWDAIDWTFTGTGSYSTQCASGNLLQEVDVEAGGYGGTLVAQWRWQGGAPPLPPDACDSFVPPGHAYRDASTGLTDVSYWEKGPADVDVNSMVVVDGHYTNVTLLHTEQGSDVADTAKSDDTGAIIYGYLVTGLSGVPASGTDILVRVHGEPTCRMAIALGHDTPADVDPPPPGYTSLGADGSGGGDNPTRPASCGWSLNPLNYLKCLFIPSKGVTDEMSSVAATAAGKFPINLAMNGSAFVGGVLSGVGGSTPDEPLGTPESSDEQIPLPHIPIMELLTPGNCTTGGGLSMNGDDTCTTSGVAAPFALLRLFASGAIWLSFFWGVWRTCQAFIGVQVVGGGDSADEPFADVTEDEWHDAGYYDPTTGKMTGMAD